MAQDYYSSQDVCVEAVFEETNSICICSRVHLKDYYYTSRDYNVNPLYDECGVCYEKVPENFCEDTYDSNYQALKDSSDDPEMPYDYALDEELELMKSMGLPTSFGRKLGESKNYKGFYSAYDHDSYEEYDNENEQNDDFEESNQNGECFKINKSDNEELYIAENSNLSKVNYNEHNKINSGSSKTNVNQVSKYHGNASEFESFWTLHGDTICLNSWNEKFKDCTPPEYFEDFKQCDSFPKTVSDTCLSNKNQSAVQVDSSSCSDKNPNFGILKASGVDDIVLNCSSDNCDSALKNMNDKFESMSFSDEIETGVVNDSNLKCDSISENVESNEISASVDSYELYSQNLLPYTNADFEDSELQLDILEKGVKGIDFPLNFDLSSVIDSPNNTSFEECDINSNELAYCPSENSSFDIDFKTLKENCPEAIDRKHTQNPLFICTKSDEEYEAEVKSQSLEELWFAHCQEELDKFSKIFSENPTQLTKFSESEFSKCKYCGQVNCLVCKPEYKNDHDKMEVSDLFNDLLSNSHSKSNFSFSNELLAYPVTHNYTSEDTLVPDEVSLAENKVDDQPQVKREHCSDDESPVELPIKRMHEIESENEEPEDTIKDLGLVIRPTKCLKIKKKKHRVRKSLKKELKTHFQVDDITEDNNESEGNKKNSIDIIAEDNDENPNKITEEEDKSSELKAEEENLVENMESDGPSTVENIENVDEISNVSQDCKKENILKKYWHQRYRLFHRFDEGIKLDDESWFSVTPERIARHIAERCACGVMVDAFCGAGGNAIQFASVCYHVIAIDKDPKKIELAKHNATVYGVADFIDFIVGDYLDLAPYLKADGVFLSPPWGGPSYVNDAEYNIDKIEPDIYKIFEVSKRITQNIALFVPKNTIINQLVQLSGENNYCEVEQNFLNKKVKTITAYYGEFSVSPSVKVETS